MKGKGSEEEEVKWEENGMGKEDRVGGGAVQGNGEESRKRDRL